MKNNKIIIEISGGLGAQIFCYALKLKYELLGYEVYCDISYFNKTPLNANFGGGVSIFPWALDYYGYKISELKILNINQIKKVVQKKFNIYKDLYLDGSYQTSCVAYDALSTIDSKYFQIKEDDLEETNKILGNKSETGIVHIRRGDYLNVASRLVSDDSYISGCNLLSKMNCKRIILVSDDPINLNFYRDNINSNIFVEKYESNNIYLTHAIIRSASYVITANSQFSMSSALLNKKAIIITPRFWATQDIIEHPFTKDCSWLLMNRNLVK